jgi:molybdenum cofactor cytidylyltransferase
VTAQSVGILLAAGRGTRFGGHKLLHPLADGTPLGVASARALRATIERVVAVVRPGDAALAAALGEAGCEILYCERADAGMGASLASGVAHAADASGWVVALADMPYVRTDTIAAVVLALREGASIAAPVLADGRRGHPVGFAAQWRHDLAALGGDAGARRLLREHATRVRWLPSDDAGCVVDIDVAADLPAA